MRRYVQMSSLDKKVLFIRAKGDPSYLDLTGRGYTVVDPYFGNGIIGRIFRELFFRLKFPFRNIWYRKIRSLTDFDYIIVFDPLITEHYLKWLHAKTSGLTNLIFSYGNLVGHARHIKPELIPKEYTVFTYDENDSIKYGLKLNNHVILAEKAYHLPTDYKTIDITFIGTNKGRGKKITELESVFHEKGLKTFFYIVPDRKFPFSNIKGNRQLKYDAFLEYVSRSKCVLNYVYEGQTGISLRDIEALSNGIKLITNNVSIQNRFFYNSRDVFLLGKDDLNNIGKFVSSEFMPLCPEFFTYYSFESWLLTYIEGNSETISFP